jgi:cohesin complex subunit SA-1/2
VSNLLIFLVILPTLSLLSTHSVSLSFVVPSVFSLPQRKSDFLALARNLSDIFLESSDESVLQNTALSLVSLSRGGHTRAADARLHLQRVASSLSSRVIELLASEPGKEAGRKGKSQHALKKSSKRRRSSNVSTSSHSSASSNDSKEDEVSSESRDVEYAISLCLRRLRVLSKRCDLCELLDGELSHDKSAVQTIDDLCDAVVTGMEKRLKEREIVVDDTSGDYGPRVTVPDIWHSGHQSSHEVVACSVKESLSLLLSVTAWKLCLAQKDDGILVRDDEDLTSDLDQHSDVIDKYGLLVHRKQLITLLVLCFEQFLPPDANPEDNEWAYSMEHVAFADLVQAHAGQVSGDLRSLFMKEWTKAASPLLRECALTDDSPLAGGFVRYLRSKEEKVSHFRHLGFEFLCT